MREHIGIIGGGFKPFTKGHYFLVKKAAAEMDKVILLVSTANRKRKGEVSLSWEGQMENVWKKYLLKAMPANVEVYFVKNPTRTTYELLEQADKNPDNHNTYFIYGDDSDIPKYFPLDKMIKYFPRLSENKQLEHKLFNREENVSVSGTKLRSYLAAGDVESFTASLPEPVQIYGQEIFDILKEK